VKALLAAALALVAALAGCNSEHPEKDALEAKGTAPASAAQQPPQLDTEWSSQRALRERRADVFAPNAPAAPARPKAKPPPEPVRAEPPPPPPLPFAYGGKLIRGTQSCAVLTRDQRVFLACAAGDALGSGYRVQSIGENHLVVHNLALDIAQTLAFSPGPAPPARASAASAGATGTDELSLRIQGPTRVAIGEQFTLTLSLDAGGNDIPEGGRVELRYDPKVLEIAGSRQKPGIARVDIAGDSAGSPAPATVQFRVVATSPTATEIRVLATSVGVNTPQVHRIVIARGAAAGG